MTFRVALALFLSCLSCPPSLTHAQSAEDADRRANSSLRWQCELEFAPDARWQLHCEDAQAMTDFDPALDDGPPPRGWHIMTFSAPVDPLKVVQLVRAVLCGGTPCEVLLNIRDWPGAGADR